MKYKYLVKMLNMSLCLHIERYHLGLYQSLVKKRGSQIQLSGLLSQAHSQQTGVEVKSEGEPPATFSNEAFHNKLLKFIIANDKVSFVASLQCSILSQLTQLKSINSVSFIIKI